MDLLEKIENFAWGVDVVLKTVIALLVIMALTCPELVGKYKATLDNTYDKYRTYNDSTIPLDTN